MVNLTMLDALQFTVGWEEAKYIDFRLNNNKRIYYLKSLLIFLSLKVANLFGNSVHYKGVIQKYIFYHDIDQVLNKTPLPRISPTPGPFRPWCPGARGTKYIKKGIFHN